MPSRTEIRIAGFGGQGVVLAGYVLGKAVSIHSGKYATLTQSYGPESRGSACSAQVILSDAEIFYPALIKPDVVLVMSQEAESIFAGQIKEEGIVLYDSSLVTPSSDETNYLGIPATEIASGLGKKIVANMIMLGFFANQTKVVSLDSLRQTVAEVVAKQHLELNMKALYAGYSYVPGQPIFTIKQEKT